MEGHNAGRARREALFCDAPKPLKVLAAGPIGQELAHHVFEESSMPTYEVYERRVCLHR